MSKKLSDELFKGIKAIVSRLEKTEAFILEQAPQVCKEMVKEAFFDHLINLIAWSAAFLFLLASSIVCGVLSYRYTGESTEPKILLGIGSLVSFICIFPIGDGVLGEIKWIYFLKNCPKLFLLREFKDLLGK